MESSPLYQSWLEFRNQPNLSQESPIISMKTSPVSVVVRILRNQSKPSLNLYLGSTATKEDRPHVPQTKGGNRQAIKQTEEKRKEKKNGDTNPYFQATNN